MTRKHSAIAVTLIIVLIGSYFLYKKVRVPKEDTRSVYEALVNVVDQKSGNAEEDKRASLKKGDVIAVFPEGHPWTETEKTGYLIVKMKLTAEDAAKLTEAVTKPSSAKAPAGEGSPEEQQVETVQARKYTLDIDIPTVNEIMEKGQPYGDKIFTKSIIDEK